MTDEVFCEVNGKEYCDDELALARLLESGVMFANSRKYLCLDDNTVRPETIVLFVNCNDLFMWACADAEELKLDEVGDLYRAWKSNQPWAVSRWCCLHRGQRPQKVIEMSMREDGVWDEKLEALPGERA